MPRNDVAPRGGRIAVRHIWLGDGRWLSPGELVWNEAGRVLAVRRPRGRVRDLALFPGFVDAHAHLQLEPLVGSPVRDFLPWVRAVMAARAGSTAPQQHRAAVAALRALLITGTTAVGEIDSSGASPAALAEVRLAGRCYQEVTGYHLDAAAARLLVRRRAVAGTNACPAGLSPHAPYSVSRDLFRAAAVRRRYLSVHVAEVPEEQQFLHTGRGPFADLLRALGRLPIGHRPPGCGAVAWLERLGLLAPTTLLVHCQELERGDIARVAAAGAPIAVCPGTIAWFGRAAPPVPRWLAAGIPVALGTDSRASTDAFCMPAELAAAARLWPGIRPSTLLGMATSMAGAAIGRPGLGTIRRGGRADFFAVDASAAAGEPAGLLQAVVEGRVRPGAVWLAGRRLRAAASASAVELDV